jgi:hypothetical protein
MCGLLIPVVACGLLWIAFFHKDPTRFFVFVCLSFFGINLGIIERLLLISGFSHKSLKLYSIGTFFRKAVKYIGIILLHYVFTIIAICISAACFSLFPRIIRPIYQYFPVINGSTALSQSMIAILIGSLLCYLIRPAGAEFLLFFFCCKQTYYRWYLHLVDLWIPVWVIIYISIRLILLNDTVVTSEMCVILPIMISVITGRCSLIALVENQLSLRPLKSLDH